MAKKYTADDIQTLEGMAHVRLRPEMYFESCFNEQSLDALPYEVLCHALDEYYDNNCNSMQFTFYHNAFKLRYNAGMRLDIMRDGITRAEAIMTQISACSNMKKHLAVGHEFCAIGMATINAASEICKLKTVSKGQKGIFVFEKGKTVSKLIKNSDSDDEFTEIYVKADDTIFKGLKFTSEGIKAKAENINTRLEGFEITIIDKIN